MLDRRVFLLAGGPFLGIGYAYAGDDDDDEDRASRSDLQRAFQEGKIRPLADVLAEQQSRIGGNIIDAELELESGSYVYKLRVLTSDGQVNKLRIPATAGN